VVQHRSFSAAARQAGIAKSAVSRRIADLERALGVRLLQRTTRTLHPTDEGLRVYAHAAALLAAGTAVQE
jgi:DNA-binding transcriptional LysR family regulator